MDFKQLRHKLANWLVKIAIKIEPKNKKAMEFYSKLLMDYAITGGAITRIDPDVFRKDVPHAK